MVGRGDEEGDLRGMVWWEGGTRWGEGVQKQAMSRGTPYNSDNATPPAATSVTKKASKRPPPQLHSGPSYSAESFNCVRCWSAVKTPPLPLVMCFLQYAPGQLKLPI